VSRDLGHGHFQGKLFVRQTIEGWVNSAVSIFKPEYLEYGSRYG